MLAIGITLASICFALGIWQLQRAKEKESILQNIVRNSELPAYSLNDEKVENSQFRAVKANGTYLLDKTFFLDNAMYEGQAGYDVITPFLLSGINQVVLVNRGWISAMGDRRILPKVSTVENELLINGHLVAPKGKPLFTSAEQDYNQKVRLFIDIERIQKTLASPVLPWVLELQQGSERGLIQNWIKVDDSKIMMHYGYALQWFVFSLFALLLSVYACFKRIENKEE